MGRRALSYRHGDEIYTARRVREITGLKESQSRERMRRIIAGEITFEDLLRPADSRPIKKKKKPLVLEKITSEQKEQLREFSRITANDDRLIKKYYAEI